MLFLAYRAGRDVGGFGLVVAAVWYELMGADRSMLGVGILRMAHIDTSEWRGDIRLRLWNFLSETGFIYASREAMAGELSKRKSCSLRYCVRHFYLKGDSEPDY